MWFFANTRKSMDRGMGMGLAGSTGLIGTLSNHY